MINISLFSVGFLIPFLISFVSLSKNETKNSDTQLQHAQFIAKIGAYSQTLQSSTKVLSSITIAQAILESDWGESQLASQYNNFFGIKTEDTSEDRSVVLPTQEVEDGVTKTVDARFARYASYQDSLKSHANLFVNGVSWDPQRYKDVLASSDYKQAAKALVTDGYSTDPDYEQKIISIVEKYDLQRFDNLDNNYTNN